MLILSTDTPNARRLKLKPSPTFLRTCHKVYLRILITSCITDASSDRYLTRTS